MMHSNHSEGSSLDQATSSHTRQGNSENRNPEADKTVVNSHGRAGPDDPHFQSTSVSSRDSENIGDGPNKKRLSQRSQPGYCFSAKGNKLIVWAKSSRRISIYNVQSGSCSIYDAVDVSLAAAGEAYYSIVSETVNVISPHSYSD